ncbi:MAG: hypothetical protein KBF73_08835, partial [Flavobacteriales bacterium]|nr:hypothetical protein [Flavobacteriales bacterium]
MRSIKYTVLIIAFFGLFSATVQAQGWIRDKKAMYSVGMGATQVIFLPSRYMYQSRPFSSRGSVG